MMMDANKLDQSIDRLENPMNRNLKSQPKSLKPEHINNTYTQTHTHEIPMVVLGVETPKRPDEQTEEAGCCDPTLKPRRLVIVSRLGGQSVKLSRRDEVWNIN